MFVDRQGSASPASKPRDVLLVVLLERRIAGSSLTELVGRQKVAGARICSGVFTGTHRALALNALTTGVLS